MRTAADGPTRAEGREAPFRDAEVVRPKGATFWGVLPPADGIHLPVGVP